MLKREWGAESNGKLLHLSIPSKTGAWVPEFVLEDLLFSRTVALVCREGSGEFSDTLHIPAVYQI